jgi:hypothetical protein
MNVKTFELTFTFKGKKYNASCSKMKVYNYPHVRVAVPGERGRSDIYIFHEIDEPNQKYFWYEIPGIKQEIAKSIVKSLEKI